MFNAMPSTRRSINAKTQQAALSIGFLLRVPLIGAAVIGLTVTMMMMMTTMSGCGGKQSAGSEPKENVERTERAEPENTDEAKLARAQMSTCAAVCDRLVATCSVEDAKKSLDEKQLAELNLAETLPAAVADCENDCGGKDLSPRQLKVARDCVNGPEECSDFVKCLDGAK